MVKFEKGEWEGFRKWSFRRLCIMRCSARKFSLSRISPPVIKVEGRKVIGWADSYSSLAVPTGLYLRFSGLQQVVVKASGLRKWAFPLEPVNTSKRVSSMPALLLSRGLDTSP
jgi:hypothetical protein